MTGYGAGYLVPARRQRGMLVLADPRHGRVRGSCRRAASVTRVTSTRARACSELPTWLGDDGNGVPVHVVTTFLPEFASRLHELAAQAAAQLGVTLEITSYGGFRDQQLTQDILKFRDEDYAAYVKQLALSKPGAVPVPEDQWRPILPFGQSWHNYGAAADVMPVSWPAIYPNRSSATAAVQALAPAVGLSFPLPGSDPGHVQLPYDLATVQTMWLLQGANASSQPDVLQVPLPAGVSGGPPPAVGAIATAGNLLDVLSAAAGKLTAPDIGLAERGASAGMLAVAGAVLLGGLYLVGQVVQQHRR